MALPGLDNASLQPSNSSPRSLNHLRRKTQFLEECALRRPCFIAIALRVEIERRLNSRMTQNALHGLGLDLRLVTSQLENPVPEIVKTETLDGGK